MHLASLFEHLVREAAANAPDAIHFAARPNQHVGRNGQPTQTTLRALVAPDGPLVALRQNHHQVHVAIFIGRAPGMRAKQINFLRLKLSFQPLNGFFQQT